MPTLTKKLTAAFRAGTPIVYVDTTEDERVLAALHELDVERATTFLYWRASDGLRTMNGTPLRCGASGQPLEEGLLDLLLSDQSPIAGLDGIVVAHDLVGPGDSHLSARALRLLKDLYMAWEPASGRPQRRTLLVTGVNWTVPPVLAGYVATLELPVPSRKEIVAQFEDRAAHLARFGLTPRELAERAVGLPKLAIEQTVRQLESTLGSAPEPADATREAAVALIEAVKREEIRRTNLLEVIVLDEPVTLGGFAKFKTWFNRRKDFFTLSARQALRPRGVLFVGFPGCGKSLAARWISAQLGVPLVSMDLGRVLDRWVGSSEARMRTALLTLEAAAPLVLFIDELDKHIAGLGTESSGVTTRLVGQLLTWLSDHSVPVFVVATCNRPEGLPAELTRAGRFDGSFLVLLPSDDERDEIARAVAAALRVELSGEAQKRVVEVSRGFSGAEIRQLIVEAAYQAGVEATPLGPAHVQAALDWVSPLSRRPLGMELAERYDSYRTDRGYTVAGETA